MKHKRVVDDYENIFMARSLHKAFVDYCNKCDANCPMGCCYRRDWQRLDPLEPSCASMLGCFARFVLSKADDKEDRKDGD